MTIGTKAALSLAALVCAGSAGAGTFDFTSNFPGELGMPAVSGSGVIVASDTSITSYDGSATGYLVTSISGVYDGTTITGLAGINTTGLNDNLINTSNGLVDSDGISFTVSSALTGYGGNEVNIYYEFNGLYSDNGLTGNGVFTLTPVSSAPEPASWALMILGLGGLGLTLRTRRSASSPV